MTNLLERLRRRQTFILLVVIIALATALRFYRIDAQSFWHDEGNSAGLAQRDVVRILAGAAADIHPPGYYLLLAAWVRAFGMQGETPYRSLSAACGIALVAVVFVIGGRLFGRQTGLLAALLAAVNPFQVTYSQEARMYALLALLGALAILAFLLWIYVVERTRLTPGEGRLAWLLASALVVAVGAAGLYTHYVFPVMLAVQNLAFAAWWLARRTRTWRELAAWAALQVLALLLYAPWLPIEYRQVTSWPSARAPYELGPALLDSWRLLVFGPAIATEMVTVGLAGAAFLAVMALWKEPAGGDLTPRPPSLKGKGEQTGSPGDQTGSPEEQAGRQNPSPFPMREGGGVGDGVRSPAADGALPLLLLWLLAPFILIFALGLYQEAFVKFFLVASAPLCLLLAQGIVNIGRISQRARGLPGARWSSLLWAGLGAFILIALINQTDQALRALYFDPEHARDDYRGIAATIRAVQRPGDAVLFDAPNQWEVFTFYYPDNGRLFPVARTRPVDAAAEGDELARIASSHARLFVLYWAEQQADPAGFVERWLAEHTLPAYEQWYGGVRLAVYGVDSPPITGPEHALDARLGDAVALRGVTLRGAPAHPGDIVGVALYWEALAPPPARYKVFVHLVDAGGRLVAQHDAEPGDSTAWPVGQAVADRHGVWLPQDLAPGTYVLRAGLYGVDDGLRLRVQVDGREAGEWVTLGNVQVTP